MKAAQLAHKLVCRSLLGEAKRRHYLKGAIAYLDSHHWYVLTEGGEEIGERAVMSGDEAKALNDQLRGLYREAVGKEIDAGVKFGHTATKSLRWKLLKDVPVPEGLDKRQSLC